MYKYIMIVLLATSSAVTADDTWLTSVLLGAGARSRTLFLEGVYWRNELLFKRIGQNTQLSKAWSGLTGFFDFRLERDQLIMQSRVSVSMQENDVMSRVRLAFLLGGNLSDDYSKCTLTFMNSNHADFSCTTKVDPKLLQKEINDIS